MATQNVDFYNNTIENNLTDNLSVLSYLKFTAKEEAEAIIKQPVQDRGIEVVEADYESDTAYNPYPSNVLIHNNFFKNKFWFPTLNN